MRYFSPGEGCHLSHRRQRLNMWAGVLIVVLPKCSLCVMAYSSTLIMCSGRSVIRETNSFGMVILGLLIAILFWGISRNYRGERTVLALLMAAAGTLIIFFSQVGLIGDQLYYAGCGLTFFAIWLNGSFFHVMHKFKRIFQT